MPRKAAKKSTKRAVSTITPSVSLQEEPIKECTCDGPCTCNKKKSPALPILVVLAIIIALILLVNKGMIVSAIVNGKPIFRFQLTQMLVARYGQQSLETMIGESLIAGEAKKAKVAVSQEEIDKKEEQILASFGGKVTLDELLAYQGMTKNDFDSQVKLQLLVTKLLGNDVAVTDEEVAEYITKNKSVMTATDEAVLKDEARQSIVDEKVNAKIQEWFTDLKSKAKILRF